MSLPLSKIALALALFWSIVIGSIRAQPYDNTELDPLLTPPTGCAMPCFLGIQPGVTTVDDAIAMLEANDWIDGVYPAVNTVDWLWNGKQPALFDMSDQFFQGRMLIENVDGIERIANIAIGTNLSLGHVWRILGRPDRLVLFKPDSAAPPNLLVQMVVYDRYPLYLYSNLSCPMLPEAYWNAPVVVAFREPSFPLLEIEDTSPYKRPDWFFRNEPPGC